MRNVGKEGQPHQVISRRNALKATGIALTGLGGRLLLDVLYPNTAVAAPLNPGVKPSTAATTAPALPQKDKNPQDLTPEDINKIAVLYASPDAMTDFVASLSLQRKLTGSTVVKWGYEDMLRYQDKLERNRGEYRKSPDRANFSEQVAIALVAQKFVEKTGLVGVSAIARNTGSVIEVNIQSGPTDPEETAPNPVDQLAVLTAEVQFDERKPVKIQGITNNFTRDVGFGKLVNGDPTHIAAQTFRQERMETNEARFFFPFGWTRNVSIPQTPTYIALQPIFEGDQRTYLSPPNSNLHIVGIGSRMEQYVNLFYRGSNDSLKLEPYKLVGTT